MILLLIIADDFTGALDTGVQFASHGIRTRVVVDPEVDFTAHEAGVLVVDTETRHLSAGEAYDVVARLTRRAHEAGVSYIYKKTDSALRGNIGAELAAVLEASGCRQLAFLPAFPQMGRITRGGIHYVDGVPVTESPFGMDPFEPVKHAAVAELIAEQWDLPVRSFPPLTTEDAVPQDEGVLVFDADDADDLYRTGYQLLKQGDLSRPDKPMGQGHIRPGDLTECGDLSCPGKRMGQDGLKIMAGCAGFGAVLPKLLGIVSETLRPIPELDPRLLVVCGSVNPITMVQLDRAEEAGFTRLRLTLRQKLEPDYWQSDEGRDDLIRIEEMLAAHAHCIIETNDLGGNRPTKEYADRLGIDRETLRVRISGSLGYLVGGIFTSPSLGTLLLTGGDTLLQCMSCIGVRELEPICELEQGVVLASFTYSGCTRHVITKSGGFGQESLLTDLTKKLEGKI